MTYDLSPSSSRPHTLSTTPTASSITCVAGVSSNYFATTDKVGVVSLRDALYGTSQASMNTGFHGISLVTMATLLGCSNVRMCCR